MTANSKNDDTTRPETRIQPAQGQGRPHPTPTHPPRATEVTSSKYLSS